MTSFKNPTKTIDKIYLLSFMKSYPKIIKKERYKFLLSKYKKNFHKLNLDKFCYSDKNLRLELFIEYYHTSTEKITNNQLSTKDLYFYGVL